MKTTVVYHSADFDGIFCREIARKFLPDAELIGWNYGDPIIPLPDGPIYILDLSPECLFTKGAEPDFNVWVGLLSRMVWIDHHKTAIDKWNPNIPGYRIDGVAACRLVWQWFAHPGLFPSNHPQLDKRDFVERRVQEPLAVRLAGEYDIWDKRDPDAETFQYALRSRELNDITWKYLLGDRVAGEHCVSDLLESGRITQRYQQNIDSDLVTYRSYRMDWEGLNWIVLNTGRFNSLTFAALDKPETGHDALLGYMFNGKCWTVSLYHAKHRTDLDLSAIATKHGGGGHKGACGFTCAELPWTKEKLLPVC